MAYGEQVTIVSFTINLHSQMVKVGILKWLGYFFRMQELDACRKLTILNPESTRRVGKHNLRWLESVEEDLKKMGVRDLRLKSEDRGQFWKRLKLFKDRNVRRKRRSR
jgi:hypothetical protein